jgi:hypothetical protein
MRATDPATRKKVVDLYLQGVGRNESARILGIGETTVTDIINAWRQGIESQNQSLDEYEAVRELAVHCKKNGISVTDFRSNLRLRNFITRLGPDVTESQVEQYIANLSGSPNPQSLIKAAEQIAQISDVPLSELEERIKTRQAELQALEAEKVQIQKGIEEGRKILDAINVDKKAAEDFLELKEEMVQCGIGPADSPRFLNVVHIFKKYGYDPSKIMNAFLEVEDVKRLKQETDSKCRTLDASMEEVKETLPWAKQMLDLGISFEQFFVFTDIVREFAEEERMDPKAACYRVVQDLRFLTHQFGGLKRAIQQAQQTLAVMEAFTTSKQRAVMALMALESNGWTFQDIVGGLSRILDLGKRQDWWNMTQAQNWNNSGEGQHAGYPF